MSEIAAGLPSKEQFKEQVHEAFRCQILDGREVELRLEAVEEHVSTATHENFSIIFRGPADMPAEQCVYRLENETLGTFDVFLVPISKDADGMTLEAVFNQIPHTDADSKSAKV